MPSKPSPTPAAVDPEVIAFRELKQQIRDLGYFEPSLSWNLYKGITTVAFVAVAAILVIYGSDLAYSPRTHLQATGYSGLFVSVWDIPNWDGLATTARIIM